MKKYRRTLATLALLMLLSGCTAQVQTPPPDTGVPTLEGALAEETAAVQEKKESGEEETDPARECVEETQPAYQLK